MAADPAGNQAELAAGFEGLEFLIVQDLFLSPTAALADVVFPAQSFIEREGSMTTGERRVQRYYPAVQPLGESLPDWRILAKLAKALELPIELSSAAGIFLKICKEVPGYGGLTYQRLAEVEEQWPPVGGSDLYYGGTTYQNRQGIGVQLSPASQRGESFSVRWSEPDHLPTRGKLWLVPVERLYERGVTVEPSSILQSHLSVLELRLNPEDARRLNIEGGTTVTLSINGYQLKAPAQIVPGVPKGQVLVDRGSGLGIVEPVVVELKPVG